MTSTEIHQLADDRNFPFPTSTSKLIQTHASWIILTDDYVYKFKRPVQYSFLDYTTLDMRRHFLKEELRLNRRFAEDMYLDVLPVYVTDKGHRIGGVDGEIADYCLLMRRMNETKQMDLLLERGSVGEESVIKLAEHIAAFHQNAEVVHEGESWEDLYREFKDLNSVLSFIQDRIDPDLASRCTSVVEWAHGYLESIKDQLTSRVGRGMIVDGHGDLHARNIFLLDEPVLFDCIEFSKDFRHLDVLSEVAYLVMDIERLRAFDLAKVFCDTYFELNPVIENDADRQLFLFYKLHRANVMIKVLCLRAQGEEEGHTMYENEMQHLKPYFRIFFEYHDQLVRQSGH